ncbi:transposase [Proteobacteria bacterium 005FR1]|nr:transposase [Proteobacteria bacterium 005FR1]
MTRARRELVSLEDTPYYHCTTRCVRRAFLCGTDYSTGNCFEHRRGWISRRIKELAAVFTIDVAAYAVMSNHYHVVVRVDREAAEALTRDQVIERWQHLFKGPPLIQRYCAGQLLSEAEVEVVDEVVDEWRSRLMDISWFMRCLNEHIARKANAEDGCKGRFWESRFTTQALLDETALLACMAYVDLNPIRAGLADRPERSDYTSLQERLGFTPDAARNEEEEGTIPQAKLMAFAGFFGEKTPADVIPHTFPDYLELVDWTGRLVRSDKRGSIPTGLPPILQRLNIEPEQWLKAANGLERRFCHAIGPVASLSEFCQRLNKRWLHGAKACKAFYPKAVGT